MAEESPADRRSAVRRDGVPHSDGSGTYDAGDRMLDADMLDAEVLDADVLDAEVLDGEVLLPTAAPPHHGSRLQFGVRATLELPDGHSTYGLELDFAVGNGPAVVTFGPQPHQHPLSLRGMVTQIARMLGIDAIGTIGKLAGAEPWTHVFDVEIAPSLTVQLSSEPSVQLVIDLFENGNRGVHLPGKVIPSWLTFEPNFTVYTLIVGYDASRGGLDLRALVTFDEQPAAIAARGPAAADQPGKTELVSFPFPTPPADNPNLQIKYLGLGQRFGPTVDVNAPDPLAAMFDELEKTFTTNDPTTLLTQLAGYYDPRRDWFVGAHVLIRGWEVRAVFNDPVLYGLEVTCTVDMFKGLLLEILYQKLGDGLGVYYGALTLPTQFRTIQLGVVSLTLPSFRIWIYTNGDFKVSVGWPLGPNSIGIQVYVFTGGGGFYFAKLRSGDNPTSGQQALHEAGSVLAADTVSYNPILEFGLGAWFGLGRSIDSGPFSASLSLTLQGTFQGVLAWKAPPAPGPGKPPPTPSLSRAPDYYWFAATVSLIGQLQGAVDLKVIKLSVFIRLSVTAGLALETGYASQVLVSASVSVKASLKILFVTISVGFHATISETFQISGGMQPPANIEHPNNPAFAGMNDWAGGDLADVERRTLARLTAAATTRSPRELPPVPVGAQTVDLGFLLQPSAVYSESTGTANAVASLVIGCPPLTGATRDRQADPAEQTPMERLLAALASWLLREYSGNGHWDSVVQALGEGAAPPPPGWEDRIYDFLEQEITFVLHQMDLLTAGDEQHVAFFPMFSDLSLTYDGTTIDFADQAPTPASYPAAVVAYFAALALSDGGSSTDSSGQADPEPPGRPALAVAVLGDYLLTIARQLARENAATANPDPVRIAANIGGLSSRYLLSGLRLPDPASVPPEPPINPAEFVIDCGYSLTGQQFAIDATAESCRASLQMGPHPGPLAACIAFAGGATSITSSMPVAPLPPAPAPVWQGPAELDATGATITVETIPAAHAQDRIEVVRTRLPWQRPGGDQYLVPLPPAVLREAAGQAVRLTVTDTQSPSEPKPLPITPALLIPMSVRLVNEVRDSDVPDHAPGRPRGLGATTGDATSTRYAPYVYRIEGTDDETRERIAAALRGAELARTTLHVLYDAPHSGFISDKLDPQKFPVVLAKTNLSTTSQPESVTTPLRILAEADPLEPYSALLADQADFLRLLWEASVVRSGGTVLHYQDAEGAGLPVRIFCPPSEPAVDGEPTSDTATVNVVVLFDDGSPIQPWHNAFAVRLDETYEGTLYLGLATAGGEAIRDLSPSYPPGCVAFSGRWAQEELLHASDLELYGDDWVSHLYHLIQFRLDGQRPGSSPQFGTSLWSLALSPSEDADTDTDAQTYRQVVPAYRFLSEGSGNPYDAVGGAPALTMRLLDVFGNALDDDTHSAAFDVYFNDPLWNPSQWPGVRIAYRFGPGPDTSTIDLNLQFDPAAVIRTGSALGPMMVHGLSGSAAGADDKISQQVQVALQQYEQVTNQLADARTTVELRTTVLPSLRHRGDLADDMLRFAEQIVAELRKALPADEPGGSPQPLAIAIKVPIDPADLCTVAEDIVELSVTLELSRPPNLVYSDPAGRVVTGSQSNIATLAADLDPPSAGTPRAQARAASKGGDPPSDVGLAQFAADFEAVFAGFDHGAGGARLAVRSDNADLSGPDVALLWAIRWSPTDGVYVDFGNLQPAAYFALTPLSLNLQNGEAQVPTYGPDLNQPVYTGRTFSGIDLDAWAQTFLACFEDTLSPRSATAIAAADPAAFEQLMVAKQLLAQCLAAGVLSVYQPGTPGVSSGDPVAARDHLEQAALASLSAAYGIDAIVQVPAVVHTAGSATPPGLASRLFGGIDVTEDSSDSGLGTRERSRPEAVQVAVSSAKLPLVAAPETAPAYLTFSVSVEDASDAANLDLDLRWRARFAEHLVPDGVGSGYQSSEWLRVVLEREHDPLDFRLGPLAVPIPQRRFPAAPVLGTQTATQAAGMGTAGTDPLARYLRWDYTAGVTMPGLAAQDTLWLDVTYNEPITEDAVRADPEPTLFQALASFIAAWPQLSGFLHDLGTTPSGPTPQQVIEAYLTQVKPVARAWARSQGVPDPWSGDSGGFRRVVPGGQGQQVDSYQIDFRDAFTEHELVVSALGRRDEDGRCDDAGVVWPTIDGQRPNAATVRAPSPAHGGDRREAGTDEPCWYQARYPFVPPAPGQRCAFTLVWPELDVLARQTARLACWDSRNSRLSGDAIYLPTNPPFVYRTPVVSFPSAILPTIVVPSIGPLPPEPTLSGTLASALAAIDRAGTAAGLDRLVKVAMSYRFGLAGAAGLGASTAILLADQVKLGPPDRVGDGQSLAALCDELDANCRVWFDYYRPGTHNAVISVYFVLFAEAAGAQLPVLQVEKLQLAVPPGWWSPA